MKKKPATVCVPVSKKFSENITKDKIEKTTKARENYEKQTNNFKPVSDELKRSTVENIANDLDPTREAVMNFIDSQNESIEFNTYSKYLDDIVGENKRKTVDTIIQKKSEKVDKKNEKINNSFSEFEDVNYFQGDNITPPRDTTREESYSYADGTSESNARPVGFNGTWNDTSESNARPVGFNGTWNDTSESNARPAGFNNNRNGSTAAESGLGRARPENTRQATGGSGTGGSGTGGSGTGGSGTRGSGTGGIINKTKETSKASYSVVKEGVKNIAYTMDSRMREHSSELASMLQGKPGETTVNKNPYALDKQTNISLPYHGAVEKERGVSEHTIFNGKHGGKAINEFYSKTFGAASYESTLKNKNKKYERVTAYQLITGEKPLTQLGKAVTRGLEAFHKKQDSSNGGNLPRPASGGTQRVQPKFHVAAIQNDRSKVIEHLDTSITNKLIGNYRELHEKGLISSDESRYLMNQTRLKAKEIATKAINSIIDPEKAAERYNSQDVPLKSSFLDPENNHLYNTDFLRAMMIDGYLEKDVRVLVQNHMNKTIAANEYNKRFSGYELVSTSGQNEEITNQIKTSYAQNILKISLSDFNALLKLEEKKTLTGEEREKKAILYAELGNELNSWLKLRNGEFKTNKKILNSEYVTQLAERGFTREVQENDQYATAGGGSVYIYSPSINLSRILGEVSVEKGEEARRSALELFKANIEVMPNTMNKIFQTTQSLALTFGNYLRLAFTMLSSFPEIMGAAQRAIKGSDMFKYTFKTLGAVMKSVLPSYRKKMYADAMNLGLISENFASAITDRHLNSDSLTSGASKAMRALFYYNMQEWWVKYTQAINLQIGKSVLRQWGDLAVNGSGIHKNEAILRLKELGLTAADMHGWNGEIRNGFDLFTGQNINKALTQEKIQNALFRFVEESIVRSTPALKPKWAVNPQNQWMWNLKSYIYAHNNQVIMPFFKGIGGLFSEGSNYMKGAEGKGILGRMFRLASLPAYGEGLLRLMAFSIMYMPLGYMGWRLRELIQFSLFDEEAPSQQQGAAMNIYETAERSGSLGIMSIPHHLITSKSPLNERIAGTISPTAGHIARLLRPDNQRLASWAGDEAASQTNARMKLLSVLPIINQLTGYKMSQAKEIIGRYRNNSDGDY